MAEWGKKRREETCSASKETRREREREKKKKREGAQKTGETEGKKGTNKKNKKNKKGWGVRGEGEWRQEKKGDNVPVEKQTGKKK